MEGYGGSGAAITNDPTGPERRPWLVQRLPLCWKRSLGGADARTSASLRQVANGHRWRYLPAMDWIGWIRGLLDAALQWFEAHPGTASWLEAVGSITAIVFVYLFALFQGRRTRSHESIDRIRRAQGLAEFVGASM